MRLARKTSGMLAIVLCSAGLSVMNVPIAHADPLNVCEGTEAATYTPAIHIAPASTTVRASGTLTCLTDPSHPSADVQFLGSGVLSCLTGGTTSGTGELDWYDQDRTKSHFTFTLAFGARPTGEEVLVATGSITSGDYVGEPIVFTFTLLDTDPTNCLIGPGVAGDSGPLTATIGV